MKTLIVYYSYTRNNEKLALEIRKKLDCDLLKIEELKRRTGITILFDLVFSRRPAIRTKECFLRNYEHIILIAPIWGGKIGSPMRSFLLMEKTNLNQYSFLTVCSGITGQKEKIERQLSRLVGKDPLKVTELWINDFLPAERKNSIKYATGYRIGSKELVVFESAIDNFLNATGILTSQDAKKIHEYRD